LLNAGDGENVPNDADRRQSTCVTDFLDTRGTAGWPSGLAATLASPDIRSQAAEALRELIEEIRVTPDGDGNAVELVGELAALLRLSGSKNAASVSEAARSTLSVAGTRNRLCRTKLL
jgi:hypothetical protein